MYHNLGIAKFACGSLTSRPTRAYASCSMFCICLKHVEVPRIVEQKHCRQLAYHMWSFLNVKGRNQNYFQSFCRPRLDKIRINALGRIWPNISWKFTGHPFSIDMLYCDHWFQTFWGEKPQLFPRISIPKTLLRCPKSETGFLALPLRPRAIVAPGVHRGSFRQQELCSLDLALARGHVERRLASGGFPGAVGRCGFGGRRRRGRRREMTKVGQLSSTGSTNERWMFWTQHLQTVQSKKTFTNTVNKFQCIFLANDLAFNETIWNKSTTCFQTLKRPVKAIMSSIRW